MRIAGHHLFHLAGYGAHHLGVGTDDAELYREADRRAEFQTGDAYPGLGELLVDHGHQARTQTLARLQILGHHHKLGIARIGQLWGE
ncbi:hypothetical protein D3C86_1886740 [compost metagenome]